MPVQSVHRALSIIEFLGDNPSGVGLLEIASELNLPKSTCHRLLQTLSNREFVYQEEQTEKYHLSMKIAQLSGNLIENIDIRHVARPFIEHLSNEINEVVHLCIREGNYVVYIDKVESTRSLRMYSQIGKRAMLHCTAVGKVLLSDLSNEEINEVIKEVGLKKLTEHTITNEEQLREEVNEIRNNEFALDREEHELGIYCIAAPIRDYSKRTVAAISISGPIERIKDAIENDNYKQLIMETASQISHRLGYIKKAILG